ncbi:MAG TPA: LytR C-terminal domain-containing protein [Longimicrobiales bacterium]
MSYRLPLLFAALLAAVALAGSFMASRRDRGAPEPNAAGVTAGAARAMADPAPDLRRIRVEVLNGTNRPGLARSVTARLRDAGFDVVYFGNAPRADSSVVLDRAGREDAARAVAQALGISHVRSAPDPGLYLEATVILGADWPPSPGAQDHADGWWARAMSWLRLDQ